MSTTVASRSTGAVDEPSDHRPNGRAQAARRLVIKTKASFKTTEFLACLVVLVGFLGAAGLVDESNSGGFGAQLAWLYATILTVGYMLSRGLAKSGSSQPCDEDRS